MNDNRLRILLEEVVKDQSLILGVLSSPLHKGVEKILKVSIRPVIVKQQVMYQISDQDSEQVLHRNVDGNSFVALVQDRLQGKFKQATFYTTAADYHILISKKKQMTILKKAPTRITTAPVHNRKKNYILEEGIPVPFLIELGVMTPEGKVAAKKSDKFRQINRFVEMIADVVPFLNRNKTIHIVDFGCGKAYLTFALYHYLHNIAGFEIDVIGLDLKEEVIEKCQKLADTLEYSSLHFEVGDINHHCPRSHVDMVVSLHACDTATDASLEKGVRWGAEVILAVPCCQHELYGQVKNAAMDPLLQHGILKERFAALATDAARAQLLDILGYNTQILEFIDMEHTPKNLLIRAIRQKKKQGAERAVSSYLAFKKSLQITPSLEQRFHEELQQLFLDDSVKSGGADGKKK